MSFIETIVRSLQRRAEFPVLFEVRGKELCPCSGNEVLRLVSSARAQLRNQGVGPGDRVALLGPNSIHWVAADLAVLAHGAVCVPLYHRQEAKELAQMLRDCEPKLLICSDPAVLTNLRTAWNPSCPVLFLTDVVHGASGSPEDPHSVRPEDPVTIIYTSGTSGEPKGVVLTRANIDFMIQRTAARLAETTGRQSAEDRIFHFLPFCFAGSRLMLWTQLYRGNPLMISTDLKNLPEELATASPQYFLTVPAFLDRIRSAVSEKLHAAGGLPAVLYRVGAEAGDRVSRRRAGPVDLLLLGISKLVVFRKIRRKVGPNLEFIICGSAALSEETQRWCKMIGLKVLQVYGLTETTGIVTMDRKESVRTGFVGKPIDGCDVRITDEGELACRGPNLFPGYWRKPEATRAILRDGWLYTGDLAEAASDGNLKIIGRLKNIIVPASAHNVAPEPIEQQILENCPGIEHAVVVGHGKPYLAVLITGSAEDEEIVRALGKVNDALPHYKKIRKYRRLDERFTVENGLLTANQKIRRSAIETRMKRFINGIYGESEGQS
ncbi:MAG: AMP-binding protein [Pseudomonadota bacterium]